MSRDLYSVKSKEGARAIADDVSLIFGGATRAEGSMKSSASSGLSDLRLKKAEQDQDSKMGQLPLDMEDANKKHVARMLQIQQAMDTHRHDHEHAMGLLMIAMKKENEDHVQNLRQLAIVKQMADSTHVEKIGQLEREQKMDQLANAPGEFTQCTENPAKDEKSLETDTSTRADKIKVKSDMRTWATIELDKLQCEFGKFSYYIWHGKLMAHLEDENARQNSDDINAALNDIGQRYLHGLECVSVEVSDRPLNAVLCAPKIGSKLTVNQCMQTAGMYVLHRSAVHWISVAHNYVRPPYTALTDAEFNENPLRAAMKEVARRNIYLDYGDEPLLVPDEHVVMSSMPYACLKHRPQDRMGRNLLHTVDIMIGQVPEVARHNEVRGLDSLEDLYKVHGGTGLIYSIQKVWRQLPLVGIEQGGYTRYDITVDSIIYERYKIVTALLPGNNLAEGTIITPSFASIYLDGEQYHNVLLISANNSVSPRNGDSGSIWVARDSSEAVAITVGKMSCPGEIWGEVWVAILLFPCLEELCREYPDALADVSELVLFQGQPLAEREI